MTSFEPRRSSAYSEDLRWRMVWQCEGLGYSQAQAGRNLGVDRSTVTRTLQLFHATGSVSNGFQERVPKGACIQKVNDSRTDANSKLNRHETRNLLV